VQVDDTHATKASARVVWRPEGFPKTRRSQGGLEFGYEQYRGNSEQALAAGHQVTLDSRSLFGPDVLDNKVRIDQVDFSYNHLVTFGRFQLEPRGGLAWQQVDLKSRSADPSLAGLATRRHGTYLVAGISPRFNFNHVLALEGRFAYAVGSERRSTDGELALALRPAPGLSLRAGYFMRKQRLQGDGIQSDLNIDLSGPTVSMALRF
jgi:hypothetical protein